MRAVLTVLVVLVTTVWIQAEPRRAAADEPQKDDTQSELRKLQGLWQELPGGMMHEDGKQVVYQPGIDGNWFFIRDDRLIWLDKEGKPSGEEMEIRIDATAKPKRITFTPVGEGTREPMNGIYSIDGANWRLHAGLDGGPAPKQFLELNKPVKGVDGMQWLVGRGNLDGK